MSRISIKLDERRWRKVIDDLKRVERNVSTTDREVIEKCLLVSHIFCFERVKELGNKTRVEYILEAQKMNHNNAHIEFLSKFTSFKQGEEIYNKKNNEIKEK